MAAAGPDRDAALRFGGTPDRMQVGVTRYDPAQGRGRPLSLEFLREALRAVGVTAPLDEENAARAIRALLSGRDARSIVIAHGSPPVDGADGRLEVLLPQPSSDPPAADGRIDYRERGGFPTAAAGQDIARLLPPGRGRPGRDVLGRPVPARDGLPLRPVIGPGVEALPPDSRGIVRYRARRRGALLLGEASLDVTELLEIPGDVNFSTGNLRLDAGSVRIAGTVRSGFSVDAPRSVLVDGMVEDARITAGGDVLVSGGVFMSGGENAFIRAGGCVRARYAHNARIAAGGDVTVIQDIVGGGAGGSPRITAGGRIRVRAPNGRIMGGAVVCGLGLEVFQAGAENGRATTLAVSHETPQTADLVREVHALKALLERALFLLGGGDAVKSLARLSPARRAEAERLLAARPAAELRLKELQDRLAAAARAYLERVRTARIIIRGPIYPGVAVKMGGAAYHVRTPLERRIFSWDPAARRIVVGAAVG